MIVFAWRWNQHFVSDVQMGFYKWFSGRTIDTVNHGRTLKISDKVFCLFFVLFFAVVFFVVVGGGFFLCVFFVVVVLLLLFFFFFVFFFLGGGGGVSNQHVSQKAIRTTLETQLDPMGPIASRGGSLKVFLRESFATCDFAAGSRPPPPTSGSTHGKPTCFKIARPKTLTF